MPTAKATLAAADKPPASLNGALWINSDAKHLMTQDMLDGLIPSDKRINNIFKLWTEFYSQQPEFKDFPYEETRFRSRLEGLQKSVSRLVWAARYDQECHDEAKAIYPDEKHGPTGDILWRNSEADRLLEIDMANGMHLNMLPSELRLTKPEYQEFSVARFSKRVDQKREAVKPYGANPMQAAAKKAIKDRKRVKNRPAISRNANGGGVAYNNTA